MTGTTTAGRLRRHCPSRERVLRLGLLPGYRGYQRFGRSDVDGGHLGTDRASTPDRASPATQPHEPYIPNWIHRAKPGELLACPIGYHATTLHQTVQIHQTVRTLQTVRAAQTAFEIMGSCHQTGGGC